MTEGEITEICCLLLSLPQFRYAQQLFPSCGIPILFMRLGVPHKIDRCANRCSLYPPQAAVAYVARQRKALFCEHFRLMKPVGANCVRPFLICYELTGYRRSPLRLHKFSNLMKHRLPLTRELSFCQK